MIEFPERTALAEQYKRCLVAISQAQKASEINSGRQKLQALWDSAGAEDRASMIAAANELAARGAV